MLLVAELSFEMSLVKDIAFSRLNHDEDAAQVRCRRRVLAKTRSQAFGEGFDAVIPRNHVVFDGFPKWICIDPKQMTGMTSVDDGEKDAR